MTQLFPRWLRVLVLWLCVPAAGIAQEVPVIEHELENGLKLLLVPRPATRTSRPDGCHGLDRSTSVLA